MPPIRIHRHVTSETLHLPEIKPLIGRDVEIVVREEKAGVNGHGDLGPLLELAGNIEIDSVAIENLRRISTL